MPHPRSVFNYCKPYFAGIILLMVLNIRLYKLLFTSLLLLIQLFTLNAQKKADKKEANDTYVDWLFSDDPEPYGVKAKITNTYGIWPTYNIRNKPGADKLRERLDNLFDAVADKCIETSWPEAISTAAGRDRVRDQMLKYVCYQIGEIDDKYVLHVLADRNNFLPEGVRPEDDIFFIINKNDVELIVNAAPYNTSTTPPSDDNTASPSSIFELFLDEEDRPSSKTETTNTTPANTAGDFEQQLNKWIDALPAKFENIKGDKIPVKAGAIMPNDDWNCKVKLEGSEKTVVTEAWGTKEASVIAYYPEYKTQYEAIEKYRTIISKIQAAKINCCTMVQSKEMASDEMTITNWLTFGASGAYANMVVEVSYLKTFIFDPNTYKKEDRWLVTVSVYTLK